MKTEGVETGINRSRLQLTDWLLVEAALLLNDLILISLTESSFFNNPSVIEITSLAAVSDTSFCRQRHCALRPINHARGGVKSRRKVPCMQPVGHRQLLHDKSAL
jgi:hypothetical protein